MLLAAVAQELVPPLSAADHVHDIVAILVGFSLGVALMIGLEFIVSDEDAEEGQEMKETMISEGIGHGADACLGHTSEPSEPSDSGRSSRSNKSSASMRTSKAYISFRINEKNAKNTSKILIPSFPLAFAAAVYIDSGMDGIALAPARKRSERHLTSEGLPRGFCAPYRSSREDVSAAHAHRRKGPSRPEA